MSDSITSREFEYTFESENLVTTINFSDTDVILNSTKDSRENNNLPFNPSVSKTNSKLKDTGSTKQT